MADGNDNGSDDSTGTGTGGSGGARTARYPRLSGVRAELGERYRAEGQWDERRLADGIEAAAASTPDALAVVDNEVRLSYAQLAAAVAGGVSTLAARGVRPGDAAILVTGNTHQGVIAYQSLLRARTTVVGLDRRSGAAEVRFALEALPTDPWILVPDREAERLGEALALAGDRVLSLELFGAEVDPSVPAATWTEPNRDRATIIMFSSGTTGRPKGVVHSLNTLTAGLFNLERSVAHDHVATFLVSPLTSITGLMQLQLAADRHGTLLLEDRFSPTATLARINAEEPTLLGGAPVIPQRLLTAAAEAGPDVPVRLRRLTLGGSMLPRPLLELATDRYGIEIVRMYGSSEAPVFSGSLPDDPRERRLADDGVPIRGGEVRIGSSEHPQEGLLRGPNLFLGYLDPADDKGAFEDDWYRTGDQIDVTDGRLTVVGRLKEIVNRNGLKISLSELDEALLGLPGSTEHATFGLPDPATGERLVVAVAVADGANVTLQDAISHLLELGIAKRKLPEQLVRWKGPLPRTASGKIVRSRLVMDAPAMDSDLAERLREA
ncbi:acyl--CoA ligase [Frankia sp. AgPm24]|uniref:Acyl--CoA ligase n=1 Tax=Frankia umida TaxID=573489 RepID=A0ABT0JVD6_9ACTN|nr:MULTISPECIES: class I adenylate-forming enzyme family protein [Frankia]MCK9875365.1 acyl--CoA ligase [Frankia umida]MCK9923736.1 acyl--CoA ligase [Frankia sp. AgPm24]